MNEMGEKTRITVQGDNKAQLECLVQSTDRVPFRAKLCMRSDVKGLPKSLAGEHPKKLQEHAGTLEGRPRTTQ